MEKNNKNLTPDQIRKYMITEVEKIQMLISKRKHSEIERVIPKLFSNIIELADSALLLHRSKYFKSSDLILRSIFENYINLKFILKDKKSYYEKLKWYNYYWMRGYYYKFNRSKNYTNELCEINKIFKDACENIFRDVHEVYNHMDKNKRRNSKWYTYYIKKNTIKDLAIAVDCKLFYEYDYWDISREIHALDGQDNFVFDEMSNGYYINYADVDTNDDQLENIKDILVDSICIIKCYYNSFH
jgi:hypothetical protein